jgi:hypothetical protein
MIQSAWISRNDHQWHVSENTLLRSVTPRVRQFKTKKKEHKAPASPKRKSGLFLRPAKTKQDSELPRVYGKILDYAQRTSLVRKFHFRGVGMFGM